MMQNDEILQVTNLVRNQNEVGNFIIQADDGPNNTIDVPSRVAKRRPSK